MKSGIKVFGIALLAGVLGAYVFSLFSTKEVYITNQQIPAYQLTGMQQRAAPASEDFVLASALSSPCVVYIKSVGTSNEQPNWFGWYFNNQEQQVTSS